jgi:integrase
VYAAFVLVLVLGLRNGEVLGLAWGQVDLTGRSLFIEWQVQRVGRQLLRRETKTESSDAGLPAAGRLYRGLEGTTEAAEGTTGGAGHAWMSSDGLVFTGDYGTAVESRTFNRAFTARCHKARVRTITVHDARRTCATCW